MIDTGCPVCSEGDVCPGYHCWIEASDIVALLEERIEKYSSFIKEGTPEVSCYTKLLRDRREECRSIIAELKEKYELP